MHRNQEESRTELGMIRIHKNVIASIASLAATEIEGVKRVGGDFKSGLLELIGRKMSMAIKIEIDSSDEVRIEVPIVIKYGFNIPEVAAKAQENVHKTLEKMINLTPKDININVQGIERG
ncbi:MAG: Asp23/Gls24 family envelope stress response protein [Candidatus Omnitrophica bacterium]|nr:Asp23/Gls24 family envelope stress response protein [Candidatus Omnitrophota bacterium]MBU4345809.1 Asp23/Gls24 family envelope stress response protein [Candidatus Omnitrophota bacterium]MBU4473432.1 Asp23/Gls24 family envelope stress response protein [Candidatus Omnitrophota bacterium]MCG2706233.1 Asp23/Gls24 family envelope stress response protein [Candidatus Omnitrophota bacterium]